MNDVILVGGGLTGLATAALVARAGLAVTVLERAAALGGRARTDWIGGHAFNQGGHALYVGGPAMSVLRELGVAHPGGKPPTTGALAIAGGALHRLPSGLVSMLTTDLFGFGAKIETARAFATLARTNPRGLRDVTWEAWVATIATRQDVRDALGAVARVTTYANAPARASAGETIAQIKAGLGPGVLYLDDGWQTLVNGLEKVTLAAGVNIVRGAQVSGIERERGGLVVTTRDARMATRSVVVATGPATARKLLGARDLGGDVTAVQTACLDVGLAALPHPERLFALGTDRPTYFSVHSASAHLADSGATIHAMKYLNPDEASDARDDESELEGVLDLVQPG